jgi:hypothetical protein
VGPRVHLDLLEGSKSLAHKGNRTQDRPGSFTEILSPKTGSDNDGQEEFNKQSRVFTKRDSNTSYLRLKSVLQEFNIRRTIALVREQAVPCSFNRCPVLIYHLSLISTI